jgi:hypothetical protein
LAFGPIFIIFKYKEKKDMTNQSYKIISKENHKNICNAYCLELNNETYKGFNIQTKGYLLYNEGKTFDLSNNLINKYLNFDLWSEIRDINGVFLKRIAGSNQGHLINSSINRVKKYIDNNSHKLK